MKNQDTDAEPVSSRTRSHHTVLTLWVAVVAESQGYSWDEALTFGKYISGMLAQSKGRHIGIYEERTKTEEEREEKRRKREGKGVRQIQVFGMTVPVIDTDDGVRAISSGTIAMNPRSVERYLEKSFGSKLNAARDAMRFLAESVPSIREPSSREPYRLYEEFRPSVPGGRAGWGRRGILDLDHIRSLATSIGFNATTDVAVVKPKRTKIEKAKAAAEV